MYNYGLLSFMQMKNLQPKEAINRFLQSQGVTSFNANNHQRSSQYIQNNWNKFSSFVDNGLKNGTLKGKRVKLNTHYAGERERKHRSASEWDSLSPEMREFVSVIRDNDLDFTRLSTSSGFFAKRGESMPKNDPDAISRTGKNLPKLQFMFNHPLRNELIDYLKAKHNGRQDKTDSPVLKGL